MGNSDTQQATITIALVGNPNTGKSTLFSALAGVRQRVGNYPGVTVEKKTGRMQHDGQDFLLVDLPGTYSLAPRSLDEMVAVDVLLGRRDDVDPPDVVLSIIDASNLERNLYLVSQILEMGLPTVIALNMTDVARDRGIEIDLEKMRSQLDVPVVELQAHRRMGIDELKAALSEAAGSATVRPNSPFPEDFQLEVSSLEAALAKQLETSPPRFIVERLLLDVGGYVEEHLLDETHGEVREELTEARSRLKSVGLTVPMVEAMSRYAWVQQVLDGVVRRPDVRPRTLTDEIDGVLTHKFWGTLVFGLMMLLVFSSIFTWASYPMDWINGGIGAFGEWMESLMPEGALRSLVVDGIIGGVGAVVIFLPQILILFFFIAVLEDCGYMARAAYLMDKLMVRVGLSGKSFIPLLSSFACAVPGIMSARVIENPRDRLTTILVAPLMSCSARLPVYAVLIAAFIPEESYLGGVLGLQGITLFAMYLVGIVAAVVVALVLKRTVLKGDTPPFVMELPGYKLPSPRMVLHRMVDRGWGFLRRAGTIIFAVTIVIWAMMYYPRNEQATEQEIAQRKTELQSTLGETAPDDGERAALMARLDDFDDEKRLDNMRASIQQRNSLLGQMGQWIEPVVKPLGWDWRIGCAAIASFPAREVVIGVLGVIYNLGEGVLDAEEGETQLQASLREARWDDSGEKVYNTPVALSIMVFFALCAQCAATLAVIKRETNSWRWPIFTFVYMTTLAYVGALVTYRLGMWWIS